MSDKPRTFAVIGDPVAHSLSPKIQNAAFANLGIDAVYTAIRTGPDGVPEVMRSLAAAGGGGNVTLPHKAVAARALDVASESVEATGACNFFYWDEERGLCGDNTDVGAFLLAAEHVVGEVLSGRTVLLLGAGGAARAVAYACLGAGVNALDVLNRSRERAELMIGHLGDPTQARVVSDLSGVASSYDIIVNATSLGLRDSDPLPLDPARLEARCLLDLVYSPRGTPLVDAARSTGMHAEDGRRMLLEGAAAAIEVWFGLPAPRHVMARSIGLID